MKFIAHKKKRCPRKKLKVLKKLRLQIKQKCAEIDALHKIIWPQY